MMKGKHKPNYASQKLTINEKEAKRIIWSVSAALLTSTLGYKIGAGWKIWSHVVTNSNYYTDLLWLWVMIYMVVLSIDHITEYLDQRQPWKEGFQTRIVIQTLAAIVGMVLFMEAFDRMYLQINERSLVRLPRSVFQLPLSVVFPLVYSMHASLQSLKDQYFTLLGQHNEQQNQQNKTKVEPDNPIVAARDGKQIRLLDLDIDIITHEDGLNRIFTAPNNYYENNHSLAFLHERLDQNEYTRTGRNCVVSRSIVLGYIPRADKGITLELDKDYAIEVVVSKTEVDNFLAWLERNREEINSEKSSFN